MSNRIEVRVTTITWETDAIRRLEMRALGGALPPFTAGAHVDVHLPTGLSRSYSLLNAPEERHRYVIGVAREPDSRGGSRYLHESVLPGGRLVISAPRNLFALDEAAAHSVLIAGGIGVTPMLSMAKRLDRLGKSWQLHYCCRTRSMAAFLDEIAAHGDRVDLRVDDEHAGFLDIAALIRSTADAHFYCCGPKPMLAAFNGAVAATGLPPARAHVEYFQPVDDGPPPGGFQIELARSNRILTVPPGKSILETVQAAGIAATSSCEAGICGECQVTVLGGIPDHRDLVLSDAERAANTAMMICCSGAKSEKLVLDL
ncbi:PDR/VanB family oxidoreductase [Vineibacter terrae]|uniref:PDR/VanB family oxidoreductase n=1 Tax=Vineibacter terrae TaxID=2586908 RepID=UPI002E3081DF|nr:PDR/VanB family oxidoreductase [Vineibacter terrae]HEX2891575.1 PDR/VanB family oxidoreductase [Vineibacter terrae]